MPRQKRVFQLEMRLASGWLTPPNLTSLNKVTPYGSTLILKQGTNKRVDVPHWFCHPTRITTRFV